MPWNEMSLSFLGQDGTWGEDDSIAPRLAGIGIWVAMISFIESVPHWHILFPADGATFYTKALRASCIGNEMGLHGCPLFYVSSHWLHGKDYDSNVLQSYRTSQMGVAQASVREVNVSFFSMLCGSLFPCIAPALADWRSSLSGD